MQQPNSKLCIKQKQREEILKRKKKMASSDDGDDSSFYNTEDDEEDEDEEDEDEFDIHEHRKMLKDMYPSKHIANKITAGEKLKKKLKEVREKKREKERKQKKGTRKEKEEEEEEEEDNDEDKYAPIAPYNTRSRAHSDTSPTHKSKYNIVFTIGCKEDDFEDDDEDDDDDEWASCSDSNTENEDDPISSDSENDDEEEDTEDEDEDDEVEDEKEEEEKIRSRKRKMCSSSSCNASSSSSCNASSCSKKNKTKPSVSRSTPSSTPSSTQGPAEDNVLRLLTEVLSKTPDNKFVKKCITEYEATMKVESAKREKKLKKEQERNSRIFRKILRDKNTMNDFDFYDKLEVGHQKKIIKEMREINKISRIEKPYRLTLLESDMPPMFKASAMKKINSLRYMEPGSGEYHKIKNWVDTFMQIPFGKYNHLPLSIHDGVDKCHEFMENAQQTLNNAVYGLTDAKMQIMQLLGQLITNPSAIGSAVAIHGPPGTGKTNLVKEGISKILNRPFAFIALGGATDSSFLEGHGYTYEGSTWGKIVQILIDSKCMNPVIYFDELDKISDTPKGEEITGILTHLTDTSQNSQFHDKYFSEIDFDLSKCLFIFSYNDETKVNPILKDRMYRIQTKGYNQKQKGIISSNYLLPKIREQVKFSNEDIIIQDKTIYHIVDNYCNKEEGVRNLKRCLEIIFTKLNLYRLMRPGSNLFEETMTLQVTFPFTVTIEVVDKLITKSDNALNASLYMLYC